MKYKTNHDVPDHMSEYLIAKKNEFINLINNSRGEDERLDLFFSCWVSALGQELAVASIRLSPEKREELKDAFCAVFKEVIEENMKMLDEEEEGE